jgi:pyridoxal 5'-phosphate synthase glutaminase subunit Pdx2
MVQNINGDFQQHQDQPQFKIGVLGKKHFLNIYSVYTFLYSSIISALQGAFQEHIHMLQNIPQVSSAIPIRKAEQLGTIDALIIPGGESTTMALVAERSGLMEPLRDFVRSEKPTWGTCAGMILLANEANKTKKGGQNLIGGLDITVNRNQFGSQASPFRNCFCQLFLLINLIFFLLD